MHKRLDDPKRTTTLRNEIKRLLQESQQEVFIATYGVSDDDVIFNELASCAKTKNVRLLVRQRPKTTPHIHELKKKGADVRGLDYLHAKVIFAETEKGKEALVMTANLENLTDRLGIKDKETFIDEYGWTYWIHSTKKVSIGINTVCQGGDSTTIILAADSGDKLERIAKLLPALTSDFRIVGNRLRVSLKDISEQRLRILIERALNCVGCGACLSYCVNCALHLENGSINVDVNSCTQCHDCLNAATLKGSCIARHYSPRRAALITLDESSGAG